jgi:hypothetical protein
MRRDKVKAKVVQTKGKVKAKVAKTKGKVGALAAKVKSKLHSNRSNSSSSSSSSNPDDAAVMSKDEATAATKVNVQQNATAASDVTQDTGIVPAASDDSSFEFQLVDGGWPENALDEDQGALSASGVVVSTDDANPPVASDGEPEPEQPTAPLPPPSSSFGKQMRGRFEARKLKAKGNLKAIKVKLHLDRSTDADQGGSVAPLEPSNTAA